jgi:hypothetical protein
MRHTDEQSRVVVSFLVSTFFAACQGPGAGVPGDAKRAGLEQPNSCGSSLNRDLANFAGATAQELGRWEIGDDFELNAGTQQLQLTAAAKAVCRNDCTIVEAVLGLQRPETTAPDHDAAAFSQALVGGWQQQRQHDQQSAATEAHALSDVGTEPSACGSLFWYEALKRNCSGDCSLANPAALSDKLVFAGYPDNPYLQFQLAAAWNGQKGSLVAIDPTYGPDDEGTTSVGVCRAACVAISSVNLAGSCCSCSGITKLFTRAAWSASTFLCL